MTKFLLCVCVVICGSGCMSLDVTRLFRPKLREQTVQKADGFTRQRILLVDLHGVISTEPEGTFSVSAKTSPDQVKAVLNQAEDDSRIKAVILRVDSPGGGVTATDMIFHEIELYKQRTGVPVICSILGVGASGGYFVACAADEIYAHPTSIIGSIGVIARIPKVKVLADKIGYEEIIVKSGRNKDMGHPLVGLNDEELGIVQSIVDDSYERFLSTVVSHRPAFGSNDELKPLADGRVFTAGQAVENKLIDGVAYLPEVIQRAKKLAGIRDAKVVTYNYGVDPNATIYSMQLRQQQASLSMINLDLGALMRSELGVMYLWWPGR